MRLTGLSMPQIQDSEGRIISSGPGRDQLALGKRVVYRRRPGVHTHRRHWGRSGVPGAAGPRSRDRRLVVGGEMSSVWVGA